ncbi:MAG: sigma-70 family RNA polymerase sigma factor [Isosphaerales bacterium]
MTLPQDYDHKGIRRGTSVVDSGPSSTTPRYLEALFHSGTLAGLSDRDLLERFASRRGENDETAELAFAALLARHGAMVLRVCRAVLGDRHEAEDAFQATFLVLASRAGSIRRGASVGSWLHGVAWRVSARARSRALRQRRHERRLAEMTTHTTGGEWRDPSPDDDSGRVLQEEIGRLPDRFRAAVVLCYLEGLTHETAAEQSGCPVGTIRSRLATARERLRKRLTRRGVAPAAIPMGLSRTGLVSVSGAGRGSPDPAPPVGLSVPAALADATVRGALRVGLGKGALAGIVTVEAVTLMEGVLKTMMTTKLMLLTATVLVAGLVTTGAGVAAYSALGRDDGLARGRAGAPNPAQTTARKQEASPTATQVPTPRPVQGAPSADEVKQKMLRVSQESVQAILREYESESEAVRNAAQKVKTPEERKALLSQRRANPASYAGALLYEAELNPGTPPAEEALIWIVKNLLAGSMVERAKEMIVRDHIRSDKIDPLFNQRQLNMTGSNATERLFREALAKNPHRKIQGLACFYLARYLVSKASVVRLGKMFDPAQLGTFSSPINRESWGQDYNERLIRLDPEALEREAALLYERVIKEFADIQLPNPLPNPTGDRLLPGRPSTLAAAARSYLHELKHFGIGQPAPEIEGVDLDGKPMKLSDYRGRVVALYFCGPLLLGASGTNQPAGVTESVRGVARRHANEPFALLGVATVNPGRSADREAFKSLLNASGLPARFWWDLDQNGNPGPIQTELNARVDLYVLDRRGVIRYKHVFMPELFEKAVATLVKELKDELGRSKKND